MAVIEPIRRLDGTIRVELFVRSLAPDTARGQQEAIIERLQRLEERGAVASVDLYVAGRCICPSTVAAETETGQFLLERFEAFSEWAASNDVALVGFRDRCVDSSLTGETVTGITFPRLCLSVYEGANLRFVAPIAGDGDQTTVSDSVKVFEERVLEGT
ncbi:HTH domain-containing protein [Halomicrobium sp. LC1Hm]|uniref:HTH domain-containing protein n=1 Tax=Halomicrobium sp. LC1Hm TaxID=2610902 RepID=UPI0012984C50|nr:HTH domain-containing protein [Halomicrobium sp. LC1Hm]QGA84083.1 Uncharacterized protein LC1Hm_3057 [Halomicrobium sp. LC1Hm]